MLNHRDDSCRSQLGRHKCVLQWRSESVANKKSQLTERRPPRNGSRAGFPLEHPHRGRKGAENAYQCCRVRLLSHRAPPHDSTTPPLLPRPSRPPSCRPPERQLQRPRPRRRPRRDSPVTPHLPPRRHRPHQPPSRPQRPRPLSCRPTKRQLQRPRAWRPPSRDSAPLLDPPRVTKTPRPPEPPRPLPRQPEVWELRRHPGRCFVRLQMLLRVHCGRVMCLYRAFVDAY